MAGKREEQLKEITDRLEKGVEELFTSERYMDYLKTMSQFHNYSFNNTMLIAMQKPDATLVAGYQAWQKKFNRHVLKGEKGIQIISPAPIREREEVEKLDPVTQEPVLKDNGQPEKEIVEMVIPRFRVVTVFDVSQTDGEPLPSLGADELTGSIENYEQFMEAIRAVSLVPMRFDEIAGESHGYYHNVDKEIVIQQGMSESQTMKTAIHEVAHAKLHDRELMQNLGVEKDQMTKEVEAESIAYSVCQHFGLDTADYSFPYIAGWSSNRDMKELKTSMDTIRHTAGDFIEEMTEKLQELQRDEPEQMHLLDSDLILKMSGSMESEYAYDVIRGMGKSELLDAVREFQRLEENDAFLEEPDLEEYLSERGAEVIPWYASNGYQVENPVTFYDVEYDADTGITDIASLSSMQQTQNMVERAEYGGTLFNDDDRNLIVNYAYQLDNLEDTRILIQELAGAIQSPDLRAPNEVIQNAQAEIDALPDGMISITDMHEYGYENPEMLPLTKEKALELYHQNLEIFCLYEDGTESAYDNEPALHTHDRIYGIEKETWDKFQKQERLEQRIMAGQEEKFSIYQIRDDSPGREYKFMGTSFLEDQGMQARREDYNLMYTADFTENETLDNIFQRFNIDRPSDFYGHSLSVSDVIVVSHNGETKSYYVDSFGFAELPEFFLERTVEMETSVPEKSLAERISDYNAMRNSIYLELIPREGNEELLERAVHRDMEDMAIIYKFALREKEDGFISGTLKNSLLDTYGISEEELYQNALNTTEERFPVRLVNMGISAEQLQLKDDPSVFPSMLVASNTTMRHGATVMLYPDFFENISERLNGSFYILPSSQHEIIILPDYGEYVAEELTGLVQEVNQTDAVGEDKLSDVVLHYDAQRKVLERAENVNVMDAQETIRELAYEVGDRYLLIHETDEGYDYTFYGKNYLDLDGGLYDNPDVTIREALVDILDGEDFRLEDCRELDYEDIEAEVELAEEEHFRQVQLETNCPDSIFEEYESLKDTTEYGGVAMKIGNLYLTVQPVEDGFDYIFYDDELKEINGNTYEDPSISIQKATREIIDNEQMADIPCTAMEYKEFEAMTIKQARERLATEVTPTSQIGRREAALNGQTRTDIEELVLDYAQSQLEEMKLEEDVTLIGARIYGSRTREGLFQEGSDIDVVLSYEGSIAEDSFFNTLHEHGMKVAGMELDINPISLEKTGTLEEYLNQAEHYLDEKEQSKKELVGRTSYANGEQFEFYDKEAFLKEIDEEIEYRNSSGFQYEVLTADPELRKAVDDIVYNLMGEKNPYELSDYQEDTEEVTIEKEALQLAIEMDSLSEALDPYEYRDSVEDKEAQIQLLKEDLLVGGEKTEQLKEWFAEFKEDEELTEQIEKVLSDMNTFETKINPLQHEVEKSEPEKEATISFYVAECMEFPILGVYQDDLTMEEALEIYEQIPAERMHGIKGVGFCLEDGSMYDGEYELMAAGRVDTESINCIEHYKNSPLVQNAIVKMQEYLDAQQEKLPIQQEPVQKEQQEVERKKEPVKYEQHEEPAGKTVEASSKPEPVQTRVKRPEAKKENGKKESVLQALRNRQAKMKEQEQNKAKEKSQARKKGDMEL